MLKFIKIIMQKLGRYRLVLDRQANEPYLERYYIFLKDRKKFPFNVFVHRFLKSDPDDVHDHPWPYATLILRGGYWEHVTCENQSRDKQGNMLTNRTWRGPGHFRRCHANTFHRIELEPGVECWTLFMPGPQQREWGFDVQGRWVHSDEYLKFKAAK